MLHVATCKLQVTANSQEEQDMSVRFLNPHNVMHGSNAIGKCREASVSARFGEVKSLFGDASAFSKRSAGFRPTCEITLVTEDVAKALSIAAGATAALSFNVADAEGGADKTISAANATCLGPAEEFAGGKSGAGVATLQFVCWSASGGNPISVS
jgi:hypothetical protein